MTAMLKRLFRYESCTNHEPESAKDFDDDFALLPRRPVESFYSKLSEDQKRHAIENAPF